MIEIASVKTDFRVRKFDQDATAWLTDRLGHEPVETDFDRARIAPYEDSLTRDCNLITSAGWALLLGSLLTVPSAAYFSSTAGAIGVGTSTTAATVSDVKLGGDTGSGSTSSYYQLSGAAPTLVTASSPATMTFTATFGGSVANFAWNEFGVVSSLPFSDPTIVGTGLTPAPTLLDHGIVAQGTKASGSTWTTAVTFSFT